MDIKAIVLRCSITWQYHTTVFNTLFFMGRKNRRWKHDGWRATHKKHDDNTQSGGGVACRWGFCSLRGRWKSLLYEQLVKVLVSGVFPRAASLYVAAALKLLIINSPKGPTLILYSHKALMQGKVGANGTLGKQTSQMQMQWWAAQTEDGHMDTQTDTGERIKMKISHCELWSISKSMTGRHAKASRDFGRYGTQTMRWSSSSLFPTVNHETDARRGSEGPNLPTDLLRPSLLELYFVDCPHSPFYVFYSHKTLVKTKIMPDCILQLVWRKREKQEFAISTANICSIENYFTDTRLNLKQMRT